MNHIYKLVVVITATAVAFLLSSAGENQFNSIAVYSVTGTVFLVSALIVFLDRLAKGLSGDFLLYVLTGVFLGLISGHYLADAIKAIGVDVQGFRAALYILPVVLFGYTGTLFARSPGFRISGTGGGFKSDVSPDGVAEKILDTSVIIDGRILDIAETHFIDGPFIIPNFVLREIQLISDSPDPVKRNRGRRGLEMLNKLQQHGVVKVKISYVDYSDTREVDAKLVKLARETGGKLVTNDFNLNKVAELQGVQVLNLNNLTNALKPVVLPGEDILIDVIKEGKDENQGIGYLEDGTMVVVENGRNLLGKAVRVNVTSIIQTAAGKMIFTRASGSQDDLQDDDRNRNQQQRGDQRDRGGNKRGGGNRRDNAYEGGGGGDREKETQGGGRRRR